MKKYQHTQPGTALFRFMAVLFVIFAVVSIKVYPMIPGTIAIGIAMLLFRSLTIEISETELTWYFGPGWPRKRVLLSEVASAEVIRTSFLNGWGIHYTSRGWLYNVAGYGAVAITLSNGKKFCLGTDEPEKLARHLNGQN